MSQLVYLRMEDDALELLRKRADSPKKLGCFLTRLVYEYEARQEERRKMREEQYAESEAG